MSSDLTAIAMTIAEFRSKKLELKMLVPISLLELS